MTRPGTVSWTTRTLPFDFAGDRVVMVPRKKGAGPVDESTFEETLRKTVTEVVDDLDIQ